jgi:para-nitrobenzyl esterase
VDATTRGSACPQFDVHNNLYYGNEDCLNLSVYSPLTTSSEPLPVMVWLFGGGFAVGDGTEFGLYDGTYLAAKQNVIVVTPNYRVGALGFLSSDHLDHTNFGLLDQRAALQWVQANIEGFGGDPSKVTIFGQSAGAMSVCSHYSNGAASEGLFHAAIMESGTCDSPEFFITKAKSVQYSQEYTQSVGCTDTGDSQAYLQCIRDLPTKEIIAGKVKQGSDYVPVLSPIMPFVPTIDALATGIPKLPLQSIKDGESMAKFGVPLMVGSNQDEGTMFVPGFPVIVPGYHFPLTTTSDVELAVHHILDPVLTSEVVDGHMDELLSYYDQRTANEQMEMILRDYMFLCPGRRTARAVTNSGADAFMYHFEYKNLWADVVALGDYHGVEIFFLFDTYGLPGMEVVHPFLVGEKAMVEVVQGYWGGLAKTQVPKYSGGVPWAAYDEKTEVYMELNWPSKAKTDLNGEVCDYHDKMLNLY